MRTKAHGRHAKFSGSSETVRDSGGTGARLVAPSQSLSLNAALLRAKASRYAVYGCLIAMVAIILATALAANLQSGSLSADALIKAQATNPVLWFMDLTPFLFAIWGQLVGSMISYEAGAMVADQVYELRSHAVALENRAHHDATHDSVTDLPNRVLFHDRVTQAIQQARREERKIAIMLLDLDRFKEINDTLGHFNGDRLLKLVAMRLESVLRKGDTLARFGGDEFAIMVPGVADEDTVALVTRKIHTALKPPFALDELVLDVQASIGVVICPDHGDDVDTLVQRADVAMYVAKQGGKGTVVYEERLDEYSPHRLTLVGELRQAIENDELVLFYQPQLKAGKRDEPAAEVLVRWQHPRHGTMQPSEFIELAERTGLIKPLTRWVLKHALQQGALWHSVGLRISLAINLSARNLLDPDFPEILAGLLAASDFPRQNVLLEITETAIMADPEMALNVLARISDMGVRISIDDFGTGYSSLSYLKKLPVSELKIDRSFVGDMLVNDNDAVIVKTTIDLAHNLGLEVVAEGVENRKTLDKLMTLGCDVFQGYHFSRPIGARDLQNWFRSRIDWPQAEALANRNARLAMLAS